MIVILKLLQIRTWPFGLSISTKGVVLNSAVCTLFIMPRTLSDQASPQPWVEENIAQVKV